MLPVTLALVLDMGAGTGWDAIWLAGLGHDVVAVEPAAARRAEGAGPHPVGIRWVAAYAGGSVPGQSVRRQG
jgi:hypothetical protein